MSSVHLHLLLNHVPVMGSLFGVLILAAGLIWNNESVKKTGAVVLILAALFAAPVYLLGEPAEDVVEGLPGVTDAVIEPHESAGLIALIALGITGAVALVGLFLTRGTRPLSPLLTIVVLILALVSSGLMARTANLGGKIRHTEIRSAYATNAIPQATTEHEAGED